MMKRQNNFFLYGLCLCAALWQSCDETKDDGNRSFACCATVMGDAMTGYSCYLDGGGLVTTSESTLAGVERGYFVFQYNEDNWKTAADGSRYIDQAHIAGYNEYPVISPVSLEAINDPSVTKTDSTVTLTSFHLGYGYRGYFGFEMNLSSPAGATTAIKSFDPVLIYDPADIAPDTLQLQLYYTVSTTASKALASNVGQIFFCNVSSLATLRSWSDTVTIAVRVSDQVNPVVKIRKIDFLLPNVTEE